MTPEEQMKAHQNNSSSLGFRVDRGDRHGGVFVLVEGMEPGYVFPGSRTRTPHAFISLALPSDMHIYRERSVLNNFPKTYKFLVEGGEPVTREILDELSVLKGKRKND